jgi:hypothetical protein
VGCLIVFCFINKNPLKDRAKISFFQGSAAIRRAYAIDSILVRGDEAGDRVLAIF